MMKKVLIIGRDNTGWSIDYDRFYLERALRDLGLEVTENIFKANMIHSVWWDVLLQKSYFFLRNLFSWNKKIIATASNFIDLDNTSFDRKKFDKADKFINLWVAPSRKQYNIFKKNNISVEYLPFCVDENEFNFLDKSKKEICRILNIDYELIKNKFLIGSFQRDSLGIDLTKPKWQKNPDMLIEILRLTPYKEDLMLILAGPRRHYIINKCKKFKIHYLYIGNEPEGLIDDNDYNILDHGKMCLLYNLVDIYIVTSKSESGPKGVLEASLCKTLVYSTDVGLAGDILEKDCIINTAKEAVDKLEFLINNVNSLKIKGIINNNYLTALDICAYKNYKERLKSIYEKI